MNREEKLRQKMANDWNERARKNALHYISGSCESWIGNIEQFFAIGEERAKKIIDPLLEQWDGYSPDGTALEIGCGVGRILRPLSKRFKHVYGVDVSWEMVKRGQEMHDSPEYENITFHTNDGTSFDFLKENTIDFVFSCETFQHMPSERVVEQNIREVARVLKPSGICQIQFKIPGGFGWDYLFGGRIPFPRRLKPYIPSVLKRLYLKEFYDALRASNTWSGVAISLRKMRLLFSECGMDVTFQDDPFHPPGTRKFAIGRFKSKT